MERTMANNLLQQRGQTEVQSQCRDAGRVVNALKVALIAVLVVVAALRTAPVFMAAVSQATLRRRQLSFSGGHALNMLHTSWRSQEHKNSKAANGSRTRKDDECGTKLGLTTYFPFSFRLLIIIIDV